MSMYEEEKPEEPGAPPPAAVPEYAESTEGMAGGSWWETMSLSVCGKQLSTDQAQKAIYGLGALVVKGVRQAQSWRRLAGSAYRRPAASLGPVNGGDAIDS